MAMASMVATASTALANVMVTVTAMVTVKTKTDKQRPIKLTYETKLT